MNQQTKISAEIVAHTINEMGDDLVSFELTFPRIILSELNTHRAFTRNSSSSRAVPFKRMLKAVKDNTFIPIAWQKTHKGMQGVDYFQDEETINKCIANYIIARDFAIRQSEKLNDIGVTKQVCNRLLEPYMWHTAIVTTSKDGLINFFNQRCSIYEDEDGFKYNSKSNYIDIVNCPKTELEWIMFNKAQAEIHMRELAEGMYDIYTKSEPDKRGGNNAYHIPYYKELDKLMPKSMYSFEDYNDYLETLVKASIGKCANVSYITIDESKEKDLQYYINIYDKMIISDPFHASPFEHIAKVMTKEDYDNYFVVEDGIVTSGVCRNFKGFIQYRSLLKK